MKKTNLIIMVVLTMMATSALGRGTAYPFDVKITGNGSKSIVFIPGYACSGEVWNETRKQFEGDFTCYTLTMAGFAGTAPQPDGTFKNWESGIAKYIKEKGLKPILVGHSLGGGLAMALAADYPQLIDRVVVVDALPCLSALMNPGFKSNENNDCSEMVTQMTSLPDDQFFQMQKMNMPRMVTDTARHDLIVNWSMQSDRKVLGEIFCDFLNTDLRESVKTIQCPTLVLLEAPFKNMKAPIEAQFGDSENIRLAYADKGLHFIMFDDKEWYFNQLNHFITVK